MGNFEQKNFEKDVQKFQSELHVQISANDPFNLLYAQYFLNTQKWCEEQLNGMLDNLEANKYPVSLYTKIIMIIQRLIDIDFNQEYMQRAKKTMLKNITIMGELNPIDQDLWFIEDEAFKENVLSVVADINSAIKNHSELVSRENIGDILGYSDWVERLEGYINPTKNTWIQDVALFSKAPAELWITAIDRASPEEIYNFRHLIMTVYPHSTKRDSYLVDAETIKKIFEGMKELQPNDLIKKACLGWLSNQVEEIIKLHEPKNVE